MYRELQFKSIEDYDALEEKSSAAYTAMEQKLTTANAELEAKSKEVARELLAELEEAKAAAAAARVGEATAATESSRLQSSHVSSSVRVQSLELTVRSLELRVVHVESERDAACQAFESARVQLAAATEAAGEGEERVHEAVVQRAEAIAVLEARQEQLQQAIDEVRTPACATAKAVINWTPPSGRTPKDAGPCCMTIVTRSSFLEGKVCTACSPVHLTLARHVHWRMPLPQAGLDTAGGAHGQRERGTGAVQPPASQRRTRGGGGGGSGVPGQGGCGGQGAGEHWQEVCGGTAPAQGLRRQWCALMGTDEGRREPHHPQPRPPLGVVVVQGCNPSSGCGCGDIPPAGREHADGCTLLLRRPRRRRRWQTVQRCSRRTVSWRRHGGS